VRSRSAYIRKPYAARTPPGKQKFIETEMEAKPIYFSPPYPFDVVSQDLSEIEDSGCSVDTFSGSEEEEERAEVSSGKVVYFGGPIGAGKTFLMELVEKSLRDSGVDVSVFREPIERTDLGVFYTRSEEGPVVDQKRRDFDRLVADKRQRAGDEAIELAKKGGTVLIERSIAESGIFRPEWWEFAALSFQDKAISALWAGVKVFYILLGTELSVCIERALSRDSDLTSQGVFDSDVYTEAIVGVYNGYIEKMRDFLGETGVVPTIVMVNGASNEEMVRAVRFLIDV